MTAVTWAAEDLVAAQRHGRSRAEWVATVIEDRILEDNIPPGTLLGTRSELQEALNVATSTIAEAIKLLSDRQLVQTRTGPGGGVFVNEMGLTVRLARTMMDVSGGAGEVADALEVRDLIEPAVIVAAARARPDDDALSGARGRFAELAQASTFAEFYQRNLAFHIEVAGHVENEVLRSVYIGTIELIRDRDPQLRSRPGVDPDELLPLRVEDHRAILDAVAAGDARMATAAAEAHSRVRSRHSSQSQ